jgi:two-component system response regulator YesN
MKQTPKKLKLVIADDEELICSMLEKIINLDELSLEISSFARDGRMLLSIIEAEKPDIVITDIKMPFLSGLDVIRTARQHGYQSRFIVISGYKHFEYAQSALKYNVADYLLKPINPIELNDTLKKISDEIRLNGSDSDSNSDFRRRFFIKKILQDSEIAKMPLKEVNDLCGTIFNQGAFRFFYVKIDCTDDTITLYSNLSSVLGKIENLANECLKNIVYDILFERDIDGIIVLINYALSNEALITAAIEKLLSSTNNATNMFSGFFTTIGLSADFESLEKAGNAHEEAELAIWRRMSLGLGNIIYYKPDEYRDINEYTKKRNARPVRQAISYIENNFGSHISLDLIAKEVGLSPVYFSSIFKKETGVNLSDYLSDYRIKKAKEFLKKSNMNINEIAYNTGFQDPKYFSKLFKKAVGISPIEYRHIYG